MRKICIVTWYRSNNYGSHFQATGLYKYLESQGYEVFFLKRFEVLPYYLRHPVLLMVRADRLFHWRKMKRFMTPVPYEITEERKKRTDEYVAEHFQTLEIISMKKWREVIRQNFAFIAGSDIIWQPNLGRPGKYFLDFASYEQLDRIAYAPSTGARELPKKMWRDYRRTLKGYKALGVRETETARFFSRLLQRKVAKVIDPSMLPDVSFWEDFSDRANTEILPKGKYILCYFVMEDDAYWNYVREAEKNLNCRVVVLPMHQSDEERGYAVVKDGILYEFLWLIRHAECIITDSFHAGVASFLFEKEFYILPRKRKDEDDKFDDFLTRYGLTDRRAENLSGFCRKSEVDYSIGKAILRKDRRKAFLFLEKALE